MKSFKLVMIAMVFLGALISVNAQRKVVKIYPKHGTVVTKVHRPNIVVHKSVKFHFSNGVWYKPQGRKYVVCAAPLGITLRHLPRGYKIVRLNGRKMYKYKGIWYQKKGKGYIVVNV
jgi:uncharacterized protein DUF6515